MLPNKFYPQQFKVLKFQQLIQHNPIITPHYAIELMVPFVLHLIHFTLHVASYTRTLLTFELQPLNWANPTMCFGNLSGFMHMRSEASPEKHSGEPQFHHCIDLFHKFFSPEASHLRASSHPGHYFCSFSNGRPMAL